MSKFNIHQQIIKKVRQVTGDGKVFLHEPVFWGDEKKNLVNCVNTTFVSSVGKYVDIFEKKLKNYTKSKYVLVTNSGTSALHICCIVSGIKKNDEVLLPTFNFVASSNVLMYLGAVPHYVDVDENSLGIDIPKLDNYLKKISVKKGKYIYNKKTKRRIIAIFPTHIFGHPGNIDSILKLAKKYNLNLVEDASESIGSFYKKKHLGTFGKAGALSFNGNKTITTGSGGAILLKKFDDYTLAKKLINICKTDHFWKLEYNGLGYNYRMSNIQASLGCSQIKNLEKIISKKYLLLKKYKKIFKKISYLKVFEHFYPGRPNYWLHTIILSKNLGSTRDKILNKANKQKLMLRPAWKLMHRLPHLQKFPRMDVTNSVSLEKRLINLPSSIY